MIRNSTQSAAARCSIAAVAGRLAFRNVWMCRTASGIFSGTSFHGYRLTCALGASIADSIAHRVVGQLGTEAAGLCQHRGDHALGRALDQVPDEGPADAVAQHSL